MKPEERELLTTWYQLWLGLTGRSPALAPLLARYAEGHRAYHNAAHILDCLHHLDACPLPAALIESKPLLQIALFYHDAVYDPRASGNEAASAELARADLSAHLSESALATIVRLIRITDHRRPPGQLDEQLITDIDLAILGQPSQSFDQYERAIRKEYAHVPEEQFRVGRSEILQHFLERPQIFHLPWFIKQYEARARANIARSIRQLQPSAKETAR